MTIKEVVENPAFTYALGGAYVAACVCRVYVSRRLTRESLPLSTSSRLDQRSTLQEKVQEESSNSYSG